MKFFSSLLLFVARFCLAAIFIFAGASKIMFYEQTAQYMASKAFTAIPLFLLSAAAIELIGGLSLVLGYKTRFGALILILFLIPTTLIFHDFWSLTGVDQAIQQIMFFKNLAILGGLLYVLSSGAGGCAMDACSCKAKTPEAKT